MKSVTKAVVSTEELSVLIQNAFPGCAVTEIRELTEGMFNRAYYICGSGALADGAILKIGPREGTKLLTYEKDILRTEVAAYRLLEGKSVPVPQVLFADYGRTLIPCDYFFMSYIPGVLWKDAVAEKLQRSRPKLMEQLGRIHAEIHSVVGGHFGYPKEVPGFRYDSWPEAFLGMMGDVCRDGIADGHVLPYEAILGAAARHRETLAAVTVPRLVDFDLWAGNAILGEEADGYTIRGIIDFERCFFGDPYGDFVSTVMVFDDVQKEPDFLKGYGTAVADDEGFRIRTNLYRLYLSVIMYVETYRYEEDYARYMKEQLRGRIEKLLAEL